MLKPYRIDQFAAHGHTIKSFGIVDHVPFQLNGYNLETNFVIVVVMMGMEDFHLSRHFLRAYQVHVDLTSMKIVVRAPVKPVWHHTHSQVDDPNLPVPVALNQDLSLHPFEVTVVRATVVTANVEPLIFQNVVLHPSIAEASLQNVVTLEDRVAGHLFSRPPFCQCFELSGAAYDKTQVNYDRVDNSVCNFTSFNFAYRVSINLIVRV